MKLTCGHTFCKMNMKKFENLLKENTVSKRKIHYKALAQNFK